jgi:superfamily II DNA or RNA helicase
MKNRIRPAQPEPSPKKAIPECNNEMELRAYQQDAVDSVFKSWQNFDRALGIAPTGSGKTLIFAQVAARGLAADGGRTLILAHRDELVSQAIDKIERCTGILASKEKAELFASREAPVVVASVQSLRPDRLHTWPRNHFTRAIVDEAHHSLADSYARVIDWFRESKFLGVTATPDRGDKRDLSLVFEDIAFEIGLIDLIKAGFLCPIKVQTVPLKIDIRDVKTVAGDYAADDLGDALRPWLNKIAEVMARDFAARKILVFLPLITISQEFAALCREYGMPAEHIDGGSADRAEILTRFSRGETRLLTNAMLLIEGYDEPSIDCVVCLRPTKIRSLYAQIIGRGTRIHPGKDHLLILDFLWLTERHDLVKPTQLVAVSVAEAGRIEAQLEAADGMLGLAKEFSDSALLDAQSLEAERRRNLAEKLADGQKQRKLYDVITVATDLRDVLLTDFVPTMQWHQAPPSQGQRAALERFGIDPATVQSRGHASAMIDKLVKRANLHLATAGQVRWLVKLGHPNPTLVSFEEARAFLDEKFSRR